MAGIYVPDARTAFYEMLPKLRGKSILSIGSSRSVHPAYYTKHGAKVTCLSIEELCSNAIKYACTFDVVASYRTIPRKPAQAKPAFRAMLQVAKVGGIVQILSNYERHAPFGPPMQKLLGYNQYLEGMESFCVRGHSSVKWRDEYSLVKFEKLHDCPPFEERLEMAEALAHAFSSLLKG